MTNRDQEIAALVSDLRTVDGVQRPRVASQIASYGQQAIGALENLLSDSEWVLRYWAATLLGQIGGVEALPVLQERSQVETDGVVKLALRKSTDALEKAVRASAVQAQSTSAASLQNSIGNAMSKLKRAYRDRETYQIEPLREQLVRYQVNLCKTLHKGELGTDALNVLSAYYYDRSAEEVLLAIKHKWCWVCGADIDDQSNSHCKCGWLICRCGACQCPDYSTALSRYDNQFECTLQISRLGEAEYQRLVEARRSRSERHSANFAFARVDFTL